jgi:aryl-alcohol dehydrogenase-like predicted oxidoreductase
MRLRELGRSGLRIAPLMLGGNVFGWTADEATSFAILDAFVDGGFNAIDTADAYSYWVGGNSGGESEIVLGRWLKARGKRDDVVIATKVGLWPGHLGLSRANIRSAVEGSLKRLQTDYIDLYQSHADDEATPQDETMQAYAQLIAEGKVRAIGASNFRVMRLASAQAVAARAGLPRYEALQPEYNLMKRGIEQDLLPFCAEQGVAIIPFYGLASGFLTGKYRSEADLAKSVRGSRVKAHLHERGFRVLGALDRVSADLRATSAQVALAWLMGRITAPIASATSVAQLWELMEASRLQLTPEHVSLLDQASADASDATAQAR